MGACESLGKAVEQYIDDKLSPETPETPETQDQKGKSSLLVAISVVLTQCQVGKEPVEELAYY
jgi:hypothetical protein